MISFPPTLFKKLGQMFNRSHSPYLICYHGPKLMIDRYGFNVELIHQESTSMHGSSECHMGYLYKRIGIDDQGNKIKKNASSRSKKVSNKENDCRVLLNGKIPCDPLFVNAWNDTRRDLSTHLKDVKSAVFDNLTSRRPRRKRKAPSLYGC